MGYMRHHAIVVSSGVSELFAQAHTKAVAMFGAAQVTGILASPVNTYQSFMVGPDGSKEGWEESNKGNEQRAAFCRWIREQAYEEGSNSLDWVSVFYGDDDWKVGIEDDGDLDRRVSESKGSG